jgi:hypothetical protein
MTPKQIAKALMAPQTVKVSADDQKMFVIKPDGLASMPPGTEVDIARDEDGSVTLSVKQPNAKD